MNSASSLNMDFSQGACLRPDDLEWLSGSIDGASYAYLERDNGGSSHASYFLRLTAGASFSLQSNVRGVELFVLEGTFSDTAGDYPAGTYIRNPLGIIDNFLTQEGCKLFIKLDQFSKEDIAHVVTRPQDRQWQNGIGSLKVLGLHAHNTESSALVAWPKNEVFQSHNHMGGEEIVVISGRFIDEHGEYPAGTWIRSPHMSKHFPRVEEETLIYVKVGHLC